MEGSQQTLADLVRQMVKEEAEAAKVAAEAETPAMPHVPKVEDILGADRAPETFAEAQSIGEALAAFRKEIFTLRQELRQRAGRAPEGAAGPTETVEERTNRRLALIAQHSHYCPGCGKLSKYPRECEGTKEGPHKPIEMVSTEELGGDPALHTPAPSTDPEGLPALAA